MEPDYNAVNLSIEHPYTKADLKNARRRLLSQYHPDKADKADAVMMNAYTEIAKRVNIQYNDLLLGCISQADKDHIMAIRERNLRRKHKYEEELEVLPNPRISTVAYFMLLFIELIAYPAGNIAYGIMSHNSDWINGLYGLLIIGLSMYVTNMRDSVPKRVWLVQAGLVALPLCGVYSIWIAAATLIIPMSLHRKAYVHRKNYRQFFERADTGTDVPHADTDMDNEVIR